MKHFKISDMPKIINFLQFTFNINLISNSYFNKPNNLKKQDRPDKVNKYIYKIPHPPPKIKTEYTYVQYNTKILLHVSTLSEHVYKMSVKSTYTYIYI
jgi:hypothetical protein